MVRIRIDSQQLRQEIYAKAGSRFILAQTPETETDNVASQIVQISSQHPTPVASRKSRIHPDGCIVFHNIEVCIGRRFTV